jgi:hypothetical protein
MTGTQPARAGEIKQALRQLFSRYQQLIVIAAAVTTSFVCKPHRRGRRATIYQSLARESVEFVQ